MSKRILQHPEVPENELATSAWRSMREHDETIKFRHQSIREFYDNEDEMSDGERDLSRRNFVKLMGASTALAGMGLVSCRRPESYILPYAQGPEWIVPGRPLYYATTMPAANGGVPLVVTTHEARPTRLAPNKKHADETGTSSFVQASILNLYNTARSQKFLKKGEEATPEEFATVFQELIKTPGKLAVVFGKDESPTRNRLASVIAKKAPQTKFYTYEALANIEADQQIAQTCGAPRINQVVDFKKANRILSLDSDFLELDGKGSTVDFSKKRQGGGEGYNAETDKRKMNRLYQVESSFSLTGGMADHRLRVAPSKVSKVAVAIANEVYTLTGNADLAKAIAGQTVDFGADEAHVTDWAKQCAKDLVEQKSKSVVIVGTHQPAALHLLALAINKALGAINSTLNLYAPKSAAYGSIVDLKADVDSGVIDKVLFLTPSNPSFDAGADIEFDKLLSKVNLSIHWGERTNKTAFATDWHIPATHYLESWGDCLSASGMYSVVQPLVLPLYKNTLSEVDILTALVDGELPVKPTADTPSKGYYEVQKTFTAQYSSKPNAWNELLKNGFSNANGYQKVSSPIIQSTAELAKVVNFEASQDNLEVILAKDYSVDDGRYIDNAWLQESPDPVIKLTWDNAAIVSPKTAKDLGVYDKIVELETWNAGRPEIGEAGQARAPMVRVSVGGNSIEIPMLVGFGHADNTITLPVGYGQAADDGRVSADALDEAKQTCGDVGRNTGFNVYPLKTSSSEFLLKGAKVEGLESSYPVASTQEHHAMYGRALAREISTMDNPAKGSYSKQLNNVSKQGMDSHIPPNIPLYKSKDQNQENLLSDKKHQWAMTIDLNTCTGCNACLIACQAENNIPVVGKEQVAKGREMHWIRMDRYFASQEHEYDSHGHAKDQKTPDWVKDNPAMIPQPVACTQCESAPCETVCPVNATVHTEEGLNAMAYNRCIGTRYCANNCPFKARRFNFFDYNKRNPLVDKNLYKGPLGETKVGTSEHLQRNPNVTVRMRGVMEKCTYCVQSIELGKIKQKQITKLRAEQKGSSVGVVLSDKDLMVPTDSVKTACQEACPSDCIEFGNLLNEKDTVNKAKKSLRNYELLKYIGTFSRTTYLARVKNPNPEMPDAKYIGLATINIH